MIRTENLSKKYRNKLALDKITLEIQSGEFCALLGPNGSGKSTLLKVLGTLIKPTDGTAWVNHANIQLQASQVRASLGFVFQDVLLDKNQTVINNLLFSAELNGIEKKQAKSKIGYLLSFFELSDHALTLVKHLSGGTQRMVDIMRSVMHSPKILILDEPTAGLDKAHQTQVFEHLLHLREDTKLTILCATHQLAEVNHYDKLFFLQNGKLILQNTPEILLSSLGEYIVDIALSGENSQLSQLEHIWGKPLIQGDICSFHIPNQSILADKLKASVTIGNVKVSIRAPDIHDVFLWPPLNKASV
jgi:ABC-2 type transport system ATP-binding protein